MLLDNVFIVVALLLGITGMVCWTPMFVALGPALITKVCGPVGESIGDGALVELLGACITWLLTNELRAELTKLWFGIETIIFLTIDCCTGKWTETGGRTDGFGAFISRIGMFPVELVGSDWLAVNMFDGTVCSGFTMLAIVGCLSTCWFSTTLILSWEEGTASIVVVNGWDWWTPPGTGGPVKSESSITTSSVSASIMIISPMLISAKFIDEENISWDMINCGSTAKNSSLRKQLTNGSNLPWTRFII